MITESPLAALSDPIRRRILELLSVSELPVHEIAAEFPVSRPAISRHLRVLREAGLAEERARGRERVYGVRREALIEAKGWIEGLIGGAGRGAAPRRAAGEGRSASEQAPATSPEAPAERTTVATARRPRSSEHAADSPPREPSEPRRPGAAKTGSRSDWRSW